MLAYIPYMDPMGMPLIQGLLSVNARNLAQDVQQQTFRPISEGKDVATTRAVAGGGNKNFPIMIWWNLMTSESKWCKRIQIWIIILAKEWLAHAKDKFPISGVFFMEQSSISMECCPASHVSCGLHHGTTKSSTSWWSVSRPGSGGSSQDRSWKDPEFSSSQHGSFLDFLAKKHGIHGLKRWRSLMTWWFFWQPNEGGGDLWTRRGCSCLDLHIMKGKGLLLPSASQTCWGREMHFSIWNIYLSIYLSILSIYQSIHPSMGKPWE